MLGNSSNEWPHPHTQQNNQIDDHKGVESRFNNNNMATSLATTPPPPRVIITPFSQEHHQKQQQQNNNNQEPLRCPRCDSSNTKFCYYNNYSLSQPRHFCKACKRYWTRGGTLRNVPVGGGFRKNKRVKKRPPNNTTNNNNTSSTTNNNNTNLYDGSVNSLPSNPLFYDSGSCVPFRDHNFTNFPFLRYDLQNPPQINGLGLGFSSGLLTNNNNNDGGGFRNGLGVNPHNNKQIFQDLILTDPLLSNPTTTNTISSLFASNLQMKGGSNNFETILPSYEDSLHMKRGMSTKEVKMEPEGQNREMSNPWSGPSQNEMGQNMGSSSSISDPSIIWGSGTNLGAWIDPSFQSMI